LAAAIATPDRIAAGAPGPPPDTTEQEAADNEAAGPGAPLPAVPLEPELGSGSTDFERQLAEFSFSTFLSTEVGVDAGDYACAEPVALDRGTPITCFTVIGDDHLVIATTTVSGGTGVFEFAVVTDSVIADPDEPVASDPGAAVAPDPAANAAILSYGEAINASAPGFVAQYLTDVRIAAVPTYAFDPTAMTVTLEIALAPGSGISADDFAWTNALSLAQVHWAAGQPFRAVGATFQPGLTLVIDGAPYVSDFALMIGVADGVVGRDDWLTAVRTG
jgi:hypothetical protein